MLKAVARRGDGWLVLLQSSDLDQALQQKRPVGRVLDPFQGTLYPPNNLFSILTRGNWERVELSPDELEGVLAKINTVHGVALDDVWEIVADEPRKR